MLNYGWRTTLIVFGIISLIMSLLGFFFVIDKPEDIGLPVINQNASAVSNEKKGSIYLLI